MKIFNFIFLIIIFLFSTSSSATDLDVPNSCSYPMIVAYYSPQEIDSTLFPFYKDLCKKDLRALKNYPEMESEFKKLFLLISLLEEFDQFAYRFRKNTYSNVLVKIKPLNLDKEIEKEYLENLTRLLRNQQPKQENNLQFTFHVSEQKLCSISRLSFHCYSLVNSYNDLFHGDFPDIAKYREHFDSVVNSNYFSEFNNTKNRQAKYRKMFVEFFKDVFEI